MSEEVNCNGLWSALRGVEDALAAISEDLSNWNNTIQAPLYEPDLLPEFSEPERRIAEFRRQYENLDPNYTGLRLPSYTATNVRAPRSFFDWPSRHHRGFINTEMTILFDESLIPTFDVMEDLRAFVDHYVRLMKALYRDVSPTLRLYQVNMSSALDQRQNYLPNSWEYQLQGAMSQYDEDSFVIDSISLRFTDRDVDLGELTAGNGDGVSFRHKGRHGDWILFNLMKTTSHCVLHAFAAWVYYRNDNFRFLLEKTNPQLNELLGQFTSVLHPDGKPRGPYKFNDMDRVEKHEKVILTDLDDLDQYVAEDTVETCMYYYHNNHCYLIMHQDKISSQDMNLLRRNMDQTIVAMCHQRDLPSAESLLKPSEYYTLDIESHRNRTWAPAPKRLTEADAAPYPSVYPVNPRSRSAKGQGGGDRYTEIHEHRPLLVGIYSSLSQEFLQFTGKNAIRETLQYLYDTDEDCTIWAHNGGKYDWHFLFKESSEWTDVALAEPVNLCDLNGSLIRIVCYLKNGHTLTFKDSYRLLPASLSKLGKDFDILNKKTEDLIIEDATEEEILFDERIHEYNRIDCIALYEILECYKEMIVKNFGINPLDSVTASSLAKRIFFTKFYDQKKHPIFVPSQIPYRFIKRSYYGGRNEVFIRGVVKGRIYVYDFTSLYPAAGTRMLPYGHPKHIHCAHVTEAQVENFLLKNPGFYEVHITSPRAKHLPLHGVLRKGKLIFPIFKEVGADEEKKTSVLFSEEILKGHHLGYKYQFYQGYTYKLAPFMKESFESLFKLRKQAIANGNHALAQALKITINSMYGFNGFNKYDRTVLKVYGKDYENTLLAKEMLGEVSYQKYGDLYLAEERVDVHLEDVSIAIASAITSHARMMLYDLVEDLQKAGAEVYYTDTDSVITNYCIENDPILKAKYMLHDGKEMGELKNELGPGSSASLTGMAYADEATFITCKTYGYTHLRKDEEEVHETVVKTKGVKLVDISPEEVGMEKPLPSEKKKCEELSRRRKEHMYNSLKILLHQSIETYVGIICTSRRDKVRKNAQAADNVHVYDKMQRKIISGIYHKGTVLDSGWIVPLVV